MIAVFRAGFGQWPFNAVPISDLDYLRWKMSGPASIYGSYQGRLHGRLRLLDDRVRELGAGRRAPRLLRQSFLDACVDPAMRGRGVFSRAVAYQQCLEYRCDFSMHERSSRAEVRGRLARRDQRPFGNPIRVLSRVLAPGRRGRSRRGSTAPERESRRVRGLAARPGNRFDCRDRSDRDGAARRARRARGVLRPALRRAVRRRRSLVRPDRGARRGVPAVALRRSAQRPLPGVARSSIEASWSAMPWCGRPAIARTWPTCSRCPVAAT